MKITHLLFITFFTLGTTSCNSQNKNNMKQQNNPLMCDPETGVCEIPTNETNSDESSLITAGKKPVKVTVVNAELDEDLDVILSAYSSDEIAKLSREAEHDVYLDIFH